VETEDDYLDWLKSEIGREYGCPAYYIRTVLVHEEVAGNTFWHGAVEIFGLIGHPSAKRCFAWGHEDDQSGPNGRLVITLEALPVVSAQNAVRVQLIKDLDGAGLGSPAIRPEMR